MVHRVLGWLAGFLLVEIRGQNIERFINLCKNNKIDLWKISLHKQKRRTKFYDENTHALTFKIALADFYQLRPIARKCKVHPLVIRRYGLPFIFGKMLRHKGFCVGIAGFCCLLFFLSTRIWGISIQGESYHSAESILRYLESIDIYGGMAARDLQCNELEEKLRHKYTDIGWASVELSGSKIYIRIKEVTMIPKAPKIKKGHLIASDTGKIVSIVTRKGTAKVFAGDKVKKGEIVISGLVKIYGDSDVLYAKNYVHADGDVVIETKENYSDILKENYSKKIYTDRTRKVYEWRFGKNSFFLYNPLNNLETYKKYDIIREGGQLYPFISLRFPIYQYTKTFREMIFRDAKYTQKEAEEILLERYRYFIEKKKASGYILKKEKIKFARVGKDYKCSGSLTFWRNEDSYRVISKKNKILYKEKDTDGNNGNGN